MAAGDINDPLSQIPGIALADDSGDPGDLGAGYALLKFKNGLPVWLPNGGAVRTALARGATSQLSTLTEEASPLDADLFLMERASDGALRKVQAQNLPGGGAGGGAGRLTNLLSYNPAGDLVGLTTLTQNVWLDICPNQSFTKAAAGSALLLVVGGYCFNDGTAQYTQVEALLDSAGTPAEWFLGAQGNDNAGAYWNPLGLIAPRYITGVTSGAHTIKLRVKTNGTSTRFRLNPTSNAPEQLHVDVYEFSV